MKLMFHPAIPTTYSAHAGPPIECTVQSIYDITHYLTAARYLKLFLSSVPPVKVTADED